MFLKSDTTSSINRVHVDVSSYVAEQASGERSQSKVNGALQRHVVFGIPVLPLGHS